MQQLLIAVRGVDIIHRNLAAGIIVLTSQHYLGTPRINTCHRSQNQTQGANCDDLIVFTAQTDQTLQPRDPPSTDKHVELYRGVELYNSTTDSSTIRRSSALPPGTSITDKRFVPVSDQHSDASKLSTHVFTSSTPHRRNRLPAFPWAWLQSSPGQLPLLLILPL